MASISFKVSIKGSVADLDDYPLEFVLRRSVNDGPIKPDDPELARLRSAQAARLQQQQQQQQQQEEIRPSVFHAGDSTRKALLPLSQDPAIYNHKIGLKSTTTRPSNTPSRGSLNTINNSRRRGVNASTAAPSGYGLSEFTTSEEEDDDDDDEGNSEDEDSAEDTSDSEEEVYPVAPRRVAKPGKKLSQVLRTTTSEPAHYVAHITGRIDPWEMRMQKLQEEGKELAPLIAEKIADDFKKIEKTPVQMTATWARENDDIVQRMKSISLETEAIKERRKKETETKNQLLAKEIENCLAQIKEERDAVIRIREEAIKQAQMEKDRIAKEQEDRKNAAAAQKAAQDKQATLAAAAAAEQAQKAAEAAANRASATTSAIFVSDAGRAEYEKYSAVLERIRTVILPAVAGNPMLKKYCFGARREMVADIGQLVNKRDEIYRVATDIDAIFKRTMQAQDETAYLWVMNCTAKKLVKQAETEALVKSAPVFPLAHVAVLLFSSHPQFLDVLMARFAKKCPYVTPMYIPKGPNDSADDFLQKLAYKKSGKGWESEAQYNGRQCAMFTLYCAIMQTVPPAGQSSYPLSHGWTWMARIMNMPPRPITPSLITVFLEVCGNSFLRTYRNQAAKALRLLMTDFIPLIPRQGVDGTTRLVTLLEQYNKTGTIPVADGRDYDR
ncbi:hypothetical protein BGZ98_001935 [Dissophora globulifera]|nr:hypothetical protein BGZ98_001935 [Dissophora globulifera]